nr:immunoglobulin heavy chain junction region [Macaca mulatta]MOW49731.1 immunoglobulin heavy chain junction region [Macaca mulatta]
CARYCRGIYCYDTIDYW